MSPTQGACHAHVMPFGAALQRGGGVRFRLWAPDASTVEVCLEAGPGAGRVIAASDAGGGFREVVVAEAGAGTAYRFRIDGATQVPDPASRRQLRDVHGPSLVEDPCAFGWNDADWRGRPWTEAVLYELHVGAFTPRGTFDGVRDRLDHLAGLGVTAIELMPVADFPGRRNWGYDGVLPFAPASAYGAPEDLKRLVDAAHRRGLMVFLDVVYNHFGPDGNYLHAYADSFFTRRHATPWGEAIDFDGARSRAVRDFFLHNALYWIEEFRIDGLRLDAVHAIHDEGRPRFLEELARAVREGPGAERHVHLVVENHDNTARMLGGGPSSYDAQWDDDVHHALHCLLTGESGGYYVDFAGDPLGHLGRALAEGFAWQGEPSEHLGGAPRGEPSAHLPPASFVTFLQNHDQIGNRALGDRLAASLDERKLRAAATVVLLSPRVPMLFMGEEFGSRTPFPFFCDFGPDLARAVREGRRREFARFPEFSRPELEARIPDATERSTFEQARLDWDDAGSERGRRWLHFHRAALAVRHDAIVPLLPGAGGNSGSWRRLGRGALDARWKLGGDTLLSLVANLDDAAAADVTRPPGRLLFESDGGVAPAEGRPGLAAWSAAWFLAGAEPA